MHVQFNLADFTRRAYGTTFIEALRVQVPHISSVFLCFFYFCTEHAHTHTHTHTHIHTLTHTTARTHVFSLSHPLPLAPAPTSIPPFSTVQIHANCRIRRVYFSDRLYSEDELPAEFKLYLPLRGKDRKDATAQGAPPADAQPQGPPA